MDELDYLILIARHGVLSVMSLAFLLVGGATLIAATFRAIQKKNVPWIWYVGVVAVVIATILFAIMQNESMSMNVWFWAK
jgi:hypothetical protein